MNGTESLLKLIEAFDHAEVPYMIELFRLSEDAHAKSRFEPGMGG
jgi:hypothetical protein